MAVTARIQTRAGTARRAVRDGPDDGTARECGPAAAGSRAGVLLSLAANLAQAQPSLWGWIVAAVPPGAFLVAVSMIERRAACRLRPVAARGGVRRRSR